MQELALPLVVGTYAKIKVPAGKDSDVPIFNWECCVYLAGRPFADMSTFIDSVVFHLHQSFKNV